MFSPLQDPRSKIKYSYLLPLHCASAPEILLFIKANSPHHRTIEPVGPYILRPSPRVEWREPLNNIWVLIGYDIVNMDGIVVTIRYVVAVDITGINRVWVFCMVDCMPKELV